MFRRRKESYILTAGFPCQDVSIAGKRAGLAGERTGLFWELARVIEELKPEWFILENVPGLLSSNSRKDMWTVITTLEQFGYCVAWRILDAQYFGVAQRRRRLWIVGSLGNISSAEVLFKQESSRGDDKTINEVGQRGLCISTRDGERNDPTNETLIASTIRSNDHDTAGNTKPNNVVGFTVGTTDWGGQQEAEVETSSPTQSEQPKEEMLPLYGKTLILRKLTPLEKERLMGFPENWTSELESDGKRGHGLGNAIVPQVAQQIMERIKQVEKQSQTNTQGEGK